MFLLHSARRMNLAVIAYRAYPARLPSLKVVRKQCPEFWRAVEWIDSLFDWNQLRIGGIQLTPVQTRTYVYQLLFMHYVECDPTKEIDFVNPLNAAHVA